MTDLFSHQGELNRARHAPLADRLRPRSLDDFVGQEAILGPGRLLRRAIRADRVGNLILHGPPGTGKTTLARIIAGCTRAHFSSLNAVLAGVKDLRAEVEAARQRLGEHGRRTILFIDEVHRFNSAQQDALLPWVENGTVTLIGATTENPTFEVNKALVSRSRLFRLQPLEPADLRRLLQRALQDRDHGYGDRTVQLTPDAEAHLLQVAGGDARSLLNALELAVETTDPDPQGVIHIDLAIAEESIQQRAVLYDKQGDAHFDTISAFIKSIRGSDADAALFWLATMVEAGENPRFILRRLLIAAGEDIGLADPQAMVVVEACAAAFDRVGLPEGLYPLAHATLYLASTEKSNSSLGFFDAVKAVRSARRQSVPSHLRDANRDGALFGDGVGYRYPHAYAEHWVAQTYLPSALQGQVFWQPGALGWEGQLRLRLQQRRAAQLAAAAETEADQPELLSSSPRDPLLERWLQRQAAAEGARLDQLRQRFWEGARIGRLDRVRVLQARSLLWALDPLAAAPEGLVVVEAADGEAEQRLQAQLAVLDQLQRPRLERAAPLNTANPPPAATSTAPTAPAHPATDTPPAAAATAAIEPQPGQTHFEWLAARQPFRQLSPAALEAWLEQLQTLAAPTAQLRLLLSRPSLGPAGSLQRLLDAGNAASPLLDQVIGLEGPWLASEGLDPAVLQAGLEQRGWRVEVRRWQEPLELRLSAGVLARWFAPEAAYRHLLKPHLPAADLQALEQLFRRQRDQALPQPLEHTLLVGQRLAGPAMPAAASPAP